MVLTVAGTSRPEPKPRPFCLALVVVALLLAGALLGAVLLRAWWGEANDVWNRSVKERSNLAERCPPPPVEGWTVQLSLGGWGSPDECTYTTPDGNSDTVIAEPVLQ